MPVRFEEHSSICQLPVRLSQYIIAIEQRTSKNVLQKTYFKKRNSRQIHRSLKNITVDLFQARLSYLEPELHHRRNMHAAIPQKMDCNFLQKNYFNFRQRWSYTNTCKPFSIRRRYIYLLLTFLFLLFMSFFLGFFLSSLLFFFFFFYLVASDGLYYT